MLVTVIELIVGSSRVAVPHHVIEGHVKEYMEEYLRRYGEAHVLPKMHYLAHVSKFMQRWVFC